MIRRALAATTLVLLSPAAAQAYVPHKTRAREAEAVARRAASLRPARGATLGFVAARGGRRLAELNAGDRFIPASLMKLFTTSAALRRFGPRHRFPTRVLAPSQAATVPHLYLVGGGDPTLATARYRRLRFFPKPADRDRAPAFASGSPTIEQLARRVRSAGIRTVSGDIVVDETRFDSVRVPRGWPDRYLRGEPESGLVSALTVNEGRGDPEGRTLLRDPAMSAGAELRRALADAGVSVAGRVRRGDAPSAAARVAEVLSPPLRDIVFFVNRWSVNFPAEVLLKGLGASFGGAGSFAAGARVVRETMAGIGVPAGDLRVYDGSGLSLDNRVTPLAVARVLEWILRDRSAEALRDSLPVAGRSGTLVNRLRRGPAAGNLRGKTGLVRGVRGMAGWVAGADRVPVVYVALFNGAGRAAALTGALDLVGRSLALFPAG